MSHGVKVRVLFPVEETTVFSEYSNSRPRQVKSLFISSLQPIFEACFGGTFRQCFIHYNIKALLGYLKNVYFLSTQTMPDLKVLLHPVICPWTRHWRAIAVSSSGYCLIKRHNLHEEEADGKKKNMWHVQAQYKWSLGMSSMKSWPLVTRTASSLFGCSTKVDLASRYMLHLEVFGFYSRVCFSHSKVHGMKRWWITATSPLWGAWGGTPMVKRSASFMKMEWSFLDLWMVNALITVVKSKPIKWPC